MKFKPSPLIAALVVLATLTVAPAAGLAAQADTPTEQPANGTDAPDAADNASETPPGAQLAGVLGVGEAEIDAEIDDRAFGIRIAGAASDDARADVVAERLGDVEGRLAELEDQRDDLAEARANGSMSEGEYRARTAQLAAETRAVERAANQSADAAEGLPADLLEEKGINATAIRTLAQQASELTGPEVAEIARSIAGDRVGGPAAGDRLPFGDDGPIPDDVGPGDAGPNGTDADERGPGEDGPGAGASDGNDGSDGDENATRAPDGEADPNGTTAPDESGVNALSTLFGWW